MAYGGRRGETRYQAWERSTQSCAGAVVGLSRLAGVLSRLAKAASGHARRDQRGRPRWVRSPFMATVAATRCSAPANDTESLASVWGSTQNSFTKVASWRNT